MADNTTLYRIHTQENSFLVAEGEIAGPNDFTRGESVTFTFRFSSDTLTVPSGETYTVSAGETEVWKDTDVDGTLNVDGTLYLTGGDFAELQQYIVDAGAFALSESITYIPIYREQLPPDADVTSLVLGIEPVQELQDNDVIGVWGILESGSDVRPSALSDTQVDITLTVLSEYNELADHSAVQNTHQA